MSNPYHQIPQEEQDLREVSPEDLEIQKAREVAITLSENKMNWVSFVCCYQHFFSSDGEPRVVAETIVFDTEIEIPQIRAHEVERIERIAVTFRPPDQNYPRVFALRENFPEVPHLSFESFEFPRSLCIFEEPYAEIKLRWTAIGFIERIRKWLADTATGTLHRADQPLEPLMIGTNTPLVLPPSVFAFDQVDKIPKLNVSYHPWGENQHYFIARLEETYANGSRPPGLPFSFISIVGLPQIHGVIQRNPGNLTELHELLRGSGIDFYETLRTELKKLNRDDQTLKSGLIIMISLPKLRALGSEIEAIETRAFVCINESDKFISVRELGEKIDVWETRDGHAVDLVLFGEKRTSETTRLLTLNPCSALSRQNAPLFAGTNTRSSQKIAAVGLGALGSQIFMNMIKAADGEWTIIDEDVLLPHNLVRHAAPGVALGYPKVEILSHFANTTIDAPKISKHIVADVLNPDKQEDIIKDSFQDSDVILDCSASVAVARYLGIDIESNSRRISFFINPTGTDLILLAEDSERSIPLDSLEMQYYRLLLNNENLKDHLQQPKGQVRYSAGCRDVSSQISPDTVALCAAIGSHALRQILRQEKASLAVWRSDDQGQVQKFSLEPAASVSVNVGEWIVRADETFLSKIKDQRSKRLPVETGGVLIGSYDMQRKILYVVDTLPPPSDSVEERNHFIRGSYGLKPLIDEIQARTLNNLQYVGDWHSHPPEYSAKPSSDDLKLLKSLSNNLRQDGKPALILIAGEKENTWHIE